MNFPRIVLGLFVTIGMVVCASADTIANESDAWSLATNGLQARLTLVEQIRGDGTRWIRPFLELRNVSGSTAQMEVNCDFSHLKIEMVDADGKVIRDGLFFPRTGSVNELNTVTLPLDSSIHISLKARNWEAMRKDAAAMLSTYGGEWFIQESEKGKVYLRATLTEEKPPMTPDSQKTLVWYGTIQTPPSKIDWK